MSIEPASPITGELNMTPAVDGPSETVDGFVLPEGQAEPAPKLKALPVEGGERLGSVDGDPGGGVDGHPGDEHRRHGVAGERL